MCNFHAKCVIFTINLWIFRLFIKFQNSAGLKNSKISEFLSFQHFRCSCALARAKFGALARPFSLARAWELKNCRKTATKKFRKSLPILGHFYSTNAVKLLKMGHFLDLVRISAILWVRSSCALARAHLLPRARARGNFEIS